MGIRKLTGDTPSVMRSSLAPAYVCMAAGIAISGLSPNIWWACAGYFVGSVGTGVVWVMSGTLAQFASHSEYRGRLFSIDWGFFTLLSSGISLCAGAAVDYIGWSPQIVMLVTAGMTLLPAIIWLVAMSMLKVEGMGRQELLEGET
jgi:predicted MFS family arabinose efflux permease